MRNELFAAAVIAACAMCQDLKKRKVSNRNLMVCAAAALFLRIQWSGFWTVTWSGQDGDANIYDSLRRCLADAIAGAGVPLLLLGWLFLFRMLGAGDIKLLSVLGLLTGPAGGVTLVWRTLLFGAVLSAGILLAAGNAAERFAYFADYISVYLTTKRRVPYRGAWDPCAYLHMTVPVLMAVLSLGIR